MFLEQKNMTSLGKRVCCKPFCYISMIDHGQQRVKNAQIVLNRKSFWYHVFKFEANVLRMGYIFHKKVEYINVFIYEIRQQILFKVTSAF
jgi:hypothetical protein